MGSKYSRIRTKIVFVNLTGKGAREDVARQIRRRATKLIKLLHLFAIIDLINYTFVVDLKIMLTY